MTTATPTEAETIVELMQAMSRRIRRHIERRIEEFDLTMPLAGALRSLDEPLPMSTLADRLTCDASYVTGLADRLEDRDLVERRPDPDDRRIKHLVLTEEGLRLRHRLHEAILRDHPMLRNLDEQDLAELTRLLGKALRSDRG